FLREREVIPENEESRVARILGLARSADLPDAIQQLLDPLPLARSLRDLGVSLEELRAAAQVADNTKGHWRPMQGRLASVLEDHY
ncbi:MAG: hypothetical protein AAFY03_04425, partial [Pseudomonadota bacterium]